MVKYLTFGISVSVISWLVGIIFNGLLVKTKHYNRVSNLNFISNENVNRAIGIGYFKWVVKNTFFKFLNQKIKLEDRGTKLTEIRDEMTSAEVSHLIAFIFVTFVAMYKSISENYLMGFVIMFVNILMNLYPSLLQQVNKRRIDKLVNGRV
jgi:Glycosyl-4,4'-diaponeurosporenoate acyltransferase